MGVKFGLSCVWEKHKLREDISEQGAEENIWT
jgi:hypothetical protein